MRIETAILIADLTERTHETLREAESMSQLTSTQLNWKTDPGSWSILECIEHLNLYGNFYLPEIDLRISESRYGPDQYFQSGLLGNFFAESMLPREKLKKMRTLKSKNPLGSKLDKNTITLFIQQQMEILELLERSQKVSLGRTRTAISITKLLKLRLGDTFRFVIYHNQRHIAQAQRVILASKVSL